MTELKGFFERRRQDFECYMAAFESHKDSIMAVFNAKDFDDAVAQLADHVETMMKRMFQGLGKSFQQAISFFDPQNKKEGTPDAAATLIDPESLINLFLKGMENFKDVSPSCMSSACEFLNLQVDPALKCSIIPVRCDNSIGPSHSLAE